ncbi:hypothetical protein LINPERHAP1_LOCUS30889 [Linum perenne]
MWRMHISWSGSNPDDYQRAAFEGPWKIFVTRIGNVIGRTIRLDLATTKGARARYARVCVDVDLSKPFLGKYVLDDRTFLIEYESLENICFSCGLYGHKLDSCPLKDKPSTTEEVKNTETATPTAPQASAPAASQWMTVSRRSRGKTQRGSQASSSKDDTGSRFSALQVEDSADQVVNAMPHDRLGDPNLDLVIAEHAATLSQVLQKASKKVGGPKKSQASKIAGVESWNPLIDITNLSQPAPKPNAELLKGNTIARTQDEQLISVFLTYNNQVFQGVSGSRAPKNKPLKVGNKLICNAAKAARLSNQNSKPPKNNGKLVRAFVSKTTQPGLKLNIDTKTGMSPDQV